MQFALDTKRSFVARMTDLLPRSAAVCAIALVTIAAFTPIAASAQEQQRGVNLSLTVVGGGKKPSLLVLPIRGASGDSITAILARDLDYSDRFTIVASSAAAEPNGPLNFPVFSKLAVDGVVQGTLLPSGWLRVSLHDVAKGLVVNQKDFALPSSTGDANWRFGVHQISDGIEEWITGERGIAATRIAFERDRRIWTVDSDGANLRAVTSQGMSPQWLPSGRGLVYSVLFGNRDPIMLTDLTTGAQRTLTAANGMQDMAPSVSRDGRTVVFTRISDNGADLHVMPIDGGTPQRITVGRGKGSFQPSFSPDGQRIVFTSDRSGRSDVYISDVDGTNVELLTAGSYGERGDRYAPDWSPDGRLVAYHGDVGGSIQVMTINLRDQSVKQATSEGRNEDASWAPDSRHLVFTSQRSGTRQLWITDTETGRTRQLTRGSAARLGAWSPRLATP
jgi:TolB protein